MELLVTALVTGLTLVVLYFSQHLVAVWRFLKLAEKLPVGKKSVPIFGHSLILLEARNRLIANFEEIVHTSKAPFLIWLGPIPFLMLTKPQHIEVILGSVKYIDKPMHYRFLQPWLGTGLLTSTGQKWHTHRKILTPTFHFKILEQFVEVFVEKTEILMKKLEEKVGTGEFDMFRLVGLCALDIICETAMGVQMNAQNQDKPSDYVTACCKITDELMLRNLSPWYFPDIIYYNTPSGRRQKDYIKTLHAYSTKIIQERKVEYNKNRNNKISEEDMALGKKKRLAFLDLLLENTEDGLKLTDEEIREEVDTFMFEGHDTTTAAISWTLQMMATHPKVQDLVFEEIQNIFQRSNRPPTIKDLNDMKYLERVIKETLRLYPSVPIFTRELKEDVELDGYTLPSGMGVAIVAIFAHLEEEHFPNPKEFDPNRFLPEAMASRHPYAYIPFSAGPRNCIGQKFAMLEEKLILSQIIRNFKLHSVGEVPIALPELILRPENGIRLKVSKRVF